MNLFVFSRFHHSISSLTCMSHLQVFVSKHFTSARSFAAVRCSYGANEGQLYPLAKTFIFINKPTFILKFDEVESIEFKRYDASATSAVRNFDLAVTMKTSTGKSSGKETKEYEFKLIDRTEYKPLLDFLSSKNLPLKNAVVRLWELLMQHFLLYCCFSFSVSTYSRFISSASYAYSSPTLWFVLVIFLLSFSL